MFFTLILENAKGERVDMTATVNQYMTSRVEGLSLPTGTISTSFYAGIDGSYLNNAFFEKAKCGHSFHICGFFRFSPEKTGDEIQHGKGQYAPRRRMCRPSRNS